MKIHTVTEQEGDSSASTTFQRAVSKHGNLNQDYHDRQQTLAEDVWSQKAALECDFFEDIVIAKDGGFSEVPYLWRTTRWFETAFLILSILTNLANIIYMDVQEIVNTQWYFNTKEEKQDKFLLIRTVTDPLLQFVAHACGSKKFWTTGHTMPCCIELLGLAFLLGEMAHLAHKSMHASNEYLRWFSTQRIFLTVIRELDNYSAMMVLHYITPSILIADLMKYYHYSKERWVGEGGQRVLVAKWLELLLLRSLCLVIGFDVFVTKCRQNCTMYMMGDLSFWKAIQIQIFLMQMLAVVQLTLFVRNRLFTFIFAGEDCVMQPRESAHKNVWAALLAREIRMSFPWPKYLAIMLSFSNEDFQRLVLNEQHNGPEPDAGLEIASEPHSSHRVPYDLEKQPAWRPSRKVRLMPL